MSFAANSGGKHDVALGWDKTANAETFRQIVSDLILMDDSQRVGTARLWACTAAGLPNHSVLDCETCYATHREQHREAQYESDVVHSSP